MNDIVRISLSEVYFWFLSLLKILKKQQQQTIKQNKELYTIIRLNSNLKRGAHTHTHKFLDTHIKQKRSGTQWLLIPHKGLNRTNEF